MDELMPTYTSIYKINQPLFVINCQDIHGVETREVVNEAFLSKHNMTMWTHMIHFSDGKPLKKISSSEKKAIEKLLAQSFATEEKMALMPMQAPCTGYHAIAREDIAKGSILLYGSHYRTTLVDPDDEYIMGDASHDHVFSSKYIGNISRFVNSAFSAEDLEDEVVFLDENLKTTIATANLQTKREQIGEHGVVCYEAVRDIKKGELLLGRYGRQFFYAREIVPHLFNQATYEVVSPALYFWKSILVKDRVQNIKAAMNVIPSQKPIVALSKNSSSQQPVGEQKSTHEAERLQQLKAQKSIQRTADRITPSSEMQPKNVKQVMQAKTYADDFFSFDATIVRNFDYMIFHSSDVGEDCVTVYSSKYIRDTLNSQGQQSFFIIMPHHFQTGQAAIKKAVNVPEALRSLLFNSKRVRINDTLTNMLIYCVTIADSPERIAVTEQQLKALGFKEIEHFAIMDNGNLCFFQGYLDALCKAIMEHFPAAHEYYREIADWIYPAVGDVKWRSLNQEKDSTVWLSLDHTSENKQFLDNLCLHIQEFLPTEEKAYVTVGLNTKTKKIVLKISNAAILENYHITRFQAPQPKLLSEASHATMYAAVANDNKKSANSQLSPP